MGAAPGLTPHPQGGTHIVERNPTRLTVVVATVFGVNTVLLFHLLWRATPLPSWTKPVSSEVQLDPG